MGLSNRVSHPRRLKSWLISLTKPTQTHDILYKKKLYVCLHLSDHKENQQIKTTSPRGVPIFITLEVSILLGCDAVSLGGCSDTSDETIMLLNIPTNIIPHPTRSVTSPATPLQQPQNSHNCDVCGCLKMHLNSLYWYYTNTRYGTHPAQNTQLTSSFLVLMSNSSNLPAVWVGTATEQINVDSTGLQRIIIILQTANVVCYSMMLPNAKIVTATVRDKWMTTEHLWNNTDGGKRK